jgi:hypothetical protein
MNKYSIEGNIDFFSELYKSLDIEDCEEKTDEDNNKCLITNQTLTDKSVSLDCGHKFNYLPLYNDLVNHKLKFNCLEASSGKLNMNEIRCPYCRKKQIGILPYHDELGLKKINGVNFFDPNIKLYPNYSHNNYSNKCEYKFPNQNFDNTQPESNTNQKYIPNLLCGHHYASPISNYNPQNPSQPITYGDTTKYCYKHKKIMIKQYKKEEKVKEKEEKKKEMELQKSQLKAEKEKLKEEKDKTKQAAKETKKVAKLINKKSLSENIVLGPSNIENQLTGCVQILKTGQNKGSPCGCKIMSESLCKRHYTLSHKTELIIIN